MARTRAQEPKDVACEAPRKLTKRERDLDAKYEQGYMAGQRNAEMHQRIKEQEFAAQMKAAKGDQIVAVTELIKATTKNLSSCGYLISKLNQEKGW